MQVFEFDNALRITMPLRTLRTLLNRLYALPEAVRARSSVQISRGWMPICPQHMLSDIEIPRQLDAFAERVRSRLSDNVEDARGRLLQPLRALPARQLPKQRLSIAGNIVVVEGHA